MQSKAVTAPAAVVLIDWLITSYESNFVSFLSSSLFVILPWMSSHDTLDASQLRCR